eukprot:scaffold31985_cov84-Isochrysis_galbana.AAC.2
MRSPRSAHRTRPVGRPMASTPPPRCCRPHWPPVSSAHRPRPADLPAPSTAAAADAAPEARTRGYNWERLPRAPRDEARGIPK